MDTVDAFFYGLYMDSDLLRSLGFNPANPRIASVESYELDLRGAAKIIPKEGATVWGTVLNLPQTDLVAMYSFETTKAYKPVTITAKTINGDICSTCCYNLSVDGYSALNYEYLAKLIMVAAKLGLPRDYINVLEALNKKS